MLTGLSHLALEVKHLNRAREFYADRLGLSPTHESASEIGVRVGETTLRLRRPTAVPRGGLHVHYAFTTPESAYDDWLARLADLAPEEHQFGSYRSLYVDDPDDHCVEIGGIGGVGDDEASVAPADADVTDTPSDDTPPLTGIFEIVLEVADLAAAESRYTALGFEVVDRGEDRRRVRLRGPFDLELWEPQLGLADARGGVHVDLGLRTDDPESAVSALGDSVVARESVDGGVRVRETDGHWLTFLAD
ncbi:VOC family protein [Salinirubrum litoreum]|uniref:VOC family protein n=1 Tax=Salinirubrum litoreum TaxID=1126234 RepID=A0ABD5RAV2_9EURY|nr:VOC family protein [Salinirubrum litoreum]